LSEAAAAERIEAIQRVLKTQSQLGVLQSSDMAVLTSGKVICTTSTENISSFVDGRHRKAPWIASRSSANQNAYLAQKYNGHQ
jgi:hypothetical protein